MWLDAHLPGLVIHSWRGTTAEAGRTPSLLNNVSIPSSSPLNSNYVLWVKSICAQYPSIFVDPPRRNRRLCKSSEPVISWRPAPVFGKSECITVTGTDSIIFPLSIPQKKSQAFLITTSPDSESQCHV